MVPEWVGGREGRWGLGGVVGDRRGRWWRICPTVRHDVMRMHTCLTWMCVCFCAWLWSVDGALSGWHLHENLQWCNWSLVSDTLGSVQRMNADVFLEKIRKRKNCLLFCGKSQKTLLANSFDVYFSVSVCGLILRIYNRGKKKDLIHFFCFFYI